MKQLEHHRMRSSADMERSGINLCRVRALLDPRALCDEVDFYIGTIEKKSSHCFSKLAAATYQRGASSALEQAGGESTRRHVKIEPRTSSATNTRRTQRPRRVIVDTAPDVVGSFRILAFERIQNEPSLSPTQLPLVACDQGATERQTASFRTPEVQWEQVDQPLWNYSSVGDQRLLV